MVLVAVVVVVAIIKSSWHCLGATTQLEPVPTPNCLAQPGPSPAVPAWRGAAGHGGAQRARSRRAADSGRRPVWPAAAQARLELGQEPARAAGAAGGGSRAGCALLCAARVH